MDMSLHNVRGTFHQGNRRFAESMGKQCVPNSIMAIIYTNILPLNQWKTEHLDSILIAGDTLYKYIDIQHDYLLISDIPNHIEAFGIQYQIEKTMEIFGVLSSNTSESIGQTLDQAIRSMINTDKMTNAVICIGSSESIHSAGYACALIIGTTDCYIFDPHSRDIHGTPAEPGTAVLLHFASPEQCCTHLQMLGYTLCGSQFEINIINIRRLKYSKEMSTSMKNELTKKRQLSREEYLEIRKAKNREYMQAKRQEKSYQEKERLKNQESKRLSRQNIILKEKEKNARQQRRSNSNVKEKEASAKRQQRSDPKVREREASAKRQKRMDPKVKEKEASTMRQRRMDPKVKELEVSAKRQKRSDPKVKEKEASAKQQKRSDPKVKEKEASAIRQKRMDPNVKERETSAKRQKRSDPKVKEKEASAMRQKRMDPNVKERETSAKRRKRSDPKVKEKEASAMRQKRMDSNVKERETSAKRRKRSDPKVKEKEASAMRQKRMDSNVKERETSAKRRKRSNPKVKEKEASAMRQKRMDPNVKERETSAKRRKRSDPKVKEKEASAMRQKRMDPNVKERETSAKRQKRSDPKVKENEADAMRQRRCDPKFKENEASTKRQRRSNPNMKHNEEETCNQRHYGSTLTELLEIFNESIALGPIFVCTCCQQIWFRHSVYDIQKIKLKGVEEEQIFQRCRTHYVSMNKKEWICKTCRLAIKEKQIPKLSIFNKMGFPEIPPELEIFPMEERLIALQIAFIQLRDHPICRQTFSKGNMVNVPINIAPTINMLPRDIRDTQTIAIKFKRKKQYKCSEFYENIRPLAVWKALKYLMHNSTLYKNANIQIDTTWLERTENISSSEQQLICEGNIADGITNNLMSYENDSRNVDNSSEIHRYSEEDEDENIISMDTMLDDYDPTPVDNDISIPQELTFAPGEGQLPISVFNDDNAEYVTFPTIFCGQKRPDKHHIKVHYSDICKYELRCVDRRVASNVPNIFFKLKKLQMKQVFDKVTLAVRRYQRKGKQLKVKDVLNESTRQNLVNLDEGYYIFRTIRNSPAYLDHKKKEAFAMIRQLGFPSLFISQSAAETKWPELLRALGQVLDRKTYTDVEIEEMDWNTKCRLLKGDSATVVRYFEHRFLQFFNLVVKSPHNPIHEVTDYFMRMEFASRGTIHVHWFAYLKDAPVYEQDDNDTIAAFYDKIISCSANVPANKQKYIEYQLHRHSKTCRVGNTKRCRFGFPIPPMPKTLILEPIDFESTEEETMYKNSWTKIQHFLKEYGMGLEIKISFDEMLLDLNLSLEDYYKSVQSSLSRPKLFLKREPCEIRINNYMRNCLEFWRANHDIQLCLSPYAMVQYMLSYVTKAQKGMSVVMDRACQEAKSGNMDLKKSVRHIGNAFLNGVETSQQEAAFLVLQMPITRMSRAVIFIPTAHPDDRTFLMKDMDTLKKMDPESDDVQSSSIITEYQYRPKILERYCLADFASVLTIKYPKHVKFKDPYDDNYDDDPIDPQAEDIDTNIAELANGVIIKKRKIPRVLRYVNFNVKQDPENHYRERLLLFLPWRNEHLDLYGSFNSYEEHYRSKENQIIHIKEKSMNTTIITSKK